MKQCPVNSATGEFERKRPGREDGFTLMEILIALSIFTIGILAVAAMQMRSMQVNNMANNVTESTTWAQDKMEELITLAWNDSQLTDTTGGGSAHTDTAPDGVTNLSWTVDDEAVGGSATANIKYITVQSEYNDGVGHTKNVSISGAYPLIAVP